MFARFRAVVDEVREVSASLEPECRAVKAAAEGATQAPRGQPQSMVLGALNAAGCP